LWSGLAVASLVGQVIHAITVRPLDLSQIALAIVVAIAVMTPLAVAWLRQLVRGVWRNTAAMLAHADRLSTASAASFGAYAMVSVGWRAAYAFVARQPGASPWTEMAALTASLAAGGLVGFWYGHAARGGR
jgi:hypothetical protein